MIDDLFTALADSGLDLDWRDVADALWLAHALGPVSPVGAEQERGQDSVAGDAPARSAAADVGRRERSSRGVVDTSDRPTGSRPRYELASAGVRPGGVGLSLRPPERASLPGRLAVARSLRPLRQQRLSTRDRMLDAEATVNHYVDTGLLIPIMGAARARWFRDVAVVVDGSPTMVVWHDTVGEVVELLAHEGAFERVTRWRMTGTADEVELVSPNGLRHTPQELLDQHGRRLTIVLTDAVDAMWRGPGVWAALRSWGRLGPVALVQMLPARLWPATAMGDADVSVTSGRRGAPNWQLRVTPPWWWFDDKPPDVVPVVTLDPARLRPWARMLMGATGTEVPGVVAQPAVGDHEHDHLAADPEKLVARIRSTLSAEAFELATLVSAVEVTLPVIWLVLDALVPGGERAHVAELLVSGLLRPVTGEAATAPAAEDQRFEFAPGVREVLQRSLTTTATLDVWRSVAPYLEEATGRRPSFSLQLEGGPTADTAASASADLDHIVADLVERLGLALRATPPLEAEPPWSPSPESGAELDRAGGIEALAEMRIATLGARSADDPPLTVALADLAHRGLPELDLHPADPLAEPPVPASSAAAEPLLHTVRYRTSSRRYAHSDWPSHAECVSDLISGDVRLDGAVIAVSAADGPMPDTMRQVEVAAAIAVPSIVVALTQCELVDDEEILELVELEVRELVSTFDYPGDDLPVVRISTRSASAGDTTWLAALGDLVEALDEVMAAPARARHEPLVMPLDDYWMDPGLKVSGRVRRGQVALGDTVELRNAQSWWTAMVTDIGRSEPSSPGGSIGPGERVTLSLDLGSNPGFPGSEAAAHRNIVSTPGATAVADAVAALVHVPGVRPRRELLESERLQVELETATVTATITASPDVDYLDTSKLEDGVERVQLHLSERVVLVPGARFTLRTSGRVEARGVITHLGRSDTAGTGAMA